MAASSSRRTGSFGEPEPAEAHQQILLEVLEADEVLRAATGLVGHDIHLDGLGVLVVHPDLTTADAVAGQAVFVHALAGELAEVGLPDAALDEVRGDVALDALEARCTGDHVLNLRDEFGGLLVLQGLELVLAVPVVGDGAPRRRASGIS